jgi:hypothetical protein
MEAEEGNCCLTPPLLGQRLLEAIGSIFFPRSEVHFAVSTGIYPAMDISKNAHIAQYLAGNVDLGDNRPGGDQNAFRHLFGQAIVTEKWGASTAEMAGDAHENKDPGMANVLKDNAGAVTDLKKNGTVQLNAAIADSFVDQLNNQVGRQIATDNPGLSMKQLAVKSLEAVRDGKSYVYEVGKGGMATIKHSSMTKKQFAKALKSLNKQFE